VVLVAGIILFVNYLIDFDRWMIQGIHDCRLGMGFFSLFAFFAFVHWWWGLCDF